MEDRDIYEIMKKDKDQGMKIILDKYTGLVYHIVKNRVYKYSEVEDVTSEIFIELYEKWDKLDPDKGTIKSFIGTLATRRAIDWIRRQKDEVPLEEGIIVDENGILDNLIENEEKKTILELLNKLKEPDKTFVISRYFLKIPSAELAIKYEMNANTIDKRISRAIESLKMMWEEDSNETR
ncbi:MAG: sigma-70 family RNA polymerase sigma factor [Tissierellia bacterium]|nr:sigma-70 family RNA polymerase sigma factor [Tissierellia bacterium]